jgi:peptide deformylase
MVLLSTWFLSHSSFAESVITFYEGFKSDILEKKAEYIQPTEEGFREAEKIADKLMKELKPIMPLSGISAPQIGISKQIFLYSWDKSWENLVIVINPRILSSDAVTTSAWEVCQSAISHKNIVKVPLVKRADTIEVQYMDINGNSQHRVLKGFAARAFQHEYDHLNGINHIKDKKTRVRTFLSYAELASFVKESKKGKDPVYFAPKTVMHE